MHAVIFFELFLKYFFYLKLFLFFKNDDNYDGT